MLEKINMFMFIAAICSSRKETQVPFWVKPELENKMGTNFGTFKAESYISQVVAGLNCIVKVNIGGGSCVHIKIFVPLPHTNEGPQLNGYQPSKTLTDPIKDF
ncbi:cystatin-B-like isoform X1 [Pleurodeles waltl]|uniref:cystatin-B-like isoform X1 n=1 Tax=Pleurodeles waltl TaxID=8319 RepID=UPI00370967A5